MKKIFYLFLIILCCSFAIAQNTQPKTNPDVAQPLPDQVVLRYIQQEELRTRSEVKGYITEQMKMNIDDTQRLVDTNKVIIYRDINNIIQGAIVKLGIVWFVATLCAMLVYRFIILAVKRKFVKRGFREEFYE